MKEDKIQTQIQFDYKNIAVVLVVVVIGVLGFVIFSLNQDETTEDDQQKEVVLSEGGGESVDELKIEDNVVGDGMETKEGDVASVHYTGTLMDGTKFDSSLDRGEPFEFELGAGDVIAGWDQGVVGMRVGGKRKLTIPPGLGYGERGAGSSIPPNSTLVFEIELLEVK
jgi:FKBP-type peptidyl-prolyl cis-trans isomerase